MNILVKYWPIITAVLTVSVSYGMGFQKITTLEDAVKEQVTQQQKIEDLRSKQERIDERTEIMLDLLKQLNSKVK